MVDISSLIDEVFSRYNSESSDFSKNEILPTMIINQTFNDKVGIATGKIDGDQKSKDTKIESEIIGDYIDQSRNQKIIDSTVTNSGTGAFSLGDNYGQIANTLNQLNFDDPNKNELKQLLIQLVNIITEADLDEEEKEESLEEISAIADALQDNQNRKLKRKAKASMVIIQDIANELSPSSEMVSICHQLSDAIAKIFELCELFS